MRKPTRLVPLIEYGVIDKVVRSLLSGKEAQVFLVESEGELRAAKVYKDQTERSFKNRSGYTEGRTVRNSRDQRAMAKGSRHGREKAEETWKSTEVEMMYKLEAAGVRVPKPHAFIDGVLVMECITGPDGQPAPRIADCNFTKEEADIVFMQLIQEVVRMLCVGVIHGDLSVFNVLMEAAGPVIIDFPQSVNAAGNGNARMILMRDVANLTAHFGTGKPAHHLRYGHEMWDLYERGELGPDTQLTGRFKVPDHEIDPDKLLLELRQIEENEILDNDADDLDFDEPQDRERAPKKPSKGRTKPKPLPR
jgi:RIO kinase 1